MKMARVVKVVDDYTVVINRGSSHGLAVRDKMLLFGLGESLVDPDTGEDLGSLEVVRGRVQVTHLQEKLATLSTYEEVRHAGNKRIIKRDKGAFSYALGLPQIEEIEEGPSVERTMLQAPEVGDYAKPI